MADLSALITEGAGYSVKVNNGIGTINFLLSFVNEDQGTYSAGSYRHTGTLRRLTIKAHLDVEVRGAVPARVRFYIQPFVDAIHLKPVDFGITNFPGGVNLIFTAEKVITIERPSPDIVSVEVRAQSYRIENGNTFLDQNVAVISLGESSRFTVALA